MIQTQVNGKVKRGKIPFLFTAAVKCSIPFICVCNTEECGMVQPLIRTDDSWLWLPPFEIKFIRGKTFASGTFRDALEIVVTEYGILPNLQYVLKLWNKNCVDKRKEELGDENSGNEVITKDLSLRVIIAMYTNSDMLPMF